MFKVCSSIFSVVRCSKSSNALSSQPLGEILRTLMARAGRVVPRERLMEEARGEEWAAFDRSIDVHISNLRRKLGDTARPPQIIRTIRGVGYMIPT